MMEHLDVWDGVLLAAVVYVATISLVRLMAARRRMLSDKLHAEIRAEQVRQRRAAKMKRDAERRRKRGEAA